MNILQSFTGLFKQKSAIEEGSGGAWFSIAGNTLKPQNYYFSTVYSCVDAIAQSVSSTEFYLEVKGGTGNKENKRIYDHEILDLLHKPNNFQTGTDLLYVISCHIDTHGEAYLYPVPSLDGKTYVQLYTLDPSRMQVVYKDNEILGYWYNTPSGQRIPFEYGEIIPIIRPNPYMIWRGISTIEMAIHDIEADYNAIMWNKNFFDNGAILSGILTTDKQLGPTSFERVKSEWKSNYEGKGNNYKTVILDNGLQYTPISPKQKDMDFIESRKYSRDQILMIFKVPKIILGITEDVNRASAETGEYVYARITKKPRLNLIFEKLTRFLLPKFKNSERMVLGYDNPVPEDKEYTLKRKAESIKGGWITPNEIRQEEGREPLPGGDELVSLSKNTESVDSQISIADKNEEKKYTAFITKQQNNQQEEYLKRTYAYLDQQENILRPLLSKHYKNLISLIKVTKKRKSTSHNPDELMKEIYPDTTTWQLGLFDTLEEPEMEIIKGAFDINQDIYSLNVSFNLINAQAIEWLKDKIAETVQSVDQTLYNRAREILIRNMGEELFDIDKTKQEIVTLLGLEEEWRVERIVRNELITTYQQSAYLQYKASGLVKKKMWVTAADERVCGWCWPLHGTVIGLDDKYSSTVENKTHSSIMAPLHIQCRCCAVPYFEK